VRSLPRLPKYFGLNILPDVAETTAKCYRRTPNQGSVRKGVRAAGTKDDLGATGKTGVDAKHFQAALAAKGGS
jgi:hypothetical protein